MATFDSLVCIDVNEHVEKKKTGRAELSYLSWPWAWDTVKRMYPDATYEVKMFDGLPYVYDQNTGYMVFTSATIDGETLDMFLPVMDGANKAMKAKPYSYKVKDYKTGEYIEKWVAPATMFDINKTIMRCLVKNFAMFGLGLYIFAGEDLPTPPPDKEEIDTPVEPEPSKEYKRKKTPKDNDELLKNTTKEKVDLYNALLEKYGAKKFTDLTKEQQEKTVAWLEE